MKKQQVIRIKEEAGRCLLCHEPACSGACPHGIDIGRIPGFVIFVGFVGCLLGVAAVLMKAPDDYIGLIAGAAEAAWLLLISVWAIVYRAIVKPR